MATYRYFNPGQRTVSVRKGAGVYRIDPKRLEDRYFDIGRYEIEMNEKEAAIYVKVGTLAKCPDNSPVNQNIQAVANVSSNIPSAVDIANQERRDKRIQALSDAREASKVRRDAENAEREATERRIREEEEKDAAELAAAEAELRKLREEEKAREEEAKVQATLEPEDDEEEAPIPEKKVISKQFKQKKRIVRRD